MVEQAMALAKENNSDQAIELYTKVVGAAETPRDVMAMAKFNRALAYTAIDKQREAKQDLDEILAMPEPLTKIKKSASDKLARMKRKVVREKQVTRGGDAAQSTDSGGGH